MNLFRIKDGQLLPNVPGCETIEHVRLKNGTRASYVDLNRPDLGLVPHDGEEIVVVADSHEPFHFVRFGSMVSTALCDNERCEILLFRACNEDNGLETVIVAVSAYDTLVQDGWRIVSGEKWEQVGRERCLVRRFPNLAAAQAAMTTPGEFIVPTEEIDGWKGLIVHGGDVVANSNINSDHEQIANMLGVPDGWDIEKIHDDQPWSARSVFEHDSPFRKAFLSDRCTFVRARVTSDGGVFLVLDVYDGENGRKFFGRQFSHEEARESLSL